MSSTLHGASDGGWLARSGATSEVGRAVAAFDWATTPMGSPGSWPLELRVAAQICLTTRFPMLVMWGPDLRMIYNDGYRDMIGDKHPGALGSPLADVFPEIWDVIGPMTRQVVETAEPTWSHHQSLLLERNGFKEATQFTFSYSPLIGAGGEVVGIIDVATETTGQVLAQRRLACLSHLSAALFDAVEVSDVCAVAATALSNWRDDIVNADLYLRADDVVTLVSSTRRDAHEPLHHGILLEVTDRGTMRRFGGTALSSDQPVDGVALPLAGGRKGPRGVLHVETSPTLALDAEYEDFLTTAASTIGTALEGAHRRAAEIAEQRHISATLQAALLQPASNHATVSVRYQPAEVSLEAGGDWYDVIEVDEHCDAMVVGDCVGHGLDAAATMGQLRSAARALLLEGHGPAAALEHLDAFAATTPGSLATTVACAVIDRTVATVTYSLAGHPPPLLVAPGAASWLDHGLGVPLQVSPGAPRHQAVVSYTDGSLLVLYSDGLIERRDESLEVGLARLEEVALECVERGLDVDQVVDVLIDRLSTTARGDDVVVVAKRLSVHPR
jgi:hypothetical protein